MRNTRLRPLAALIAVAVGLALAALRPPGLEASTCGGPGKYVCKINQSCATILFFKQCTTTYDYWKLTVEEDEDDTDPKPVEPEG
jgi:hypothetical protein